MIKAENLTMHYGQLKALQGLNLEVAPGEFFAFLGPNAAGKTTTIKLLTGIMRPTSGNAWINGHHVLNEPFAAKRGLGFVPDVAVFYDKLSAVEFMEFTADIFAMDRTLAKRLTGELFEQFSLHPYAKERVESLSHGTRQRLAIAAALLHDPQTIIIDEPMVGLDPLHVRVVKDELKARAKAGTTVFMSTHLLNIAEELADRIGIIYGGKLVAVDTFENLKKAPGADGKGLEEIFLEMLHTQEQLASQDRR
jgi:ABC-2 type transport system ATP-binding protein